MKSLIEVQGIGDTTASVLIDHGICSAKALAKIKIEKLMAIPGFGGRRAPVIIQAAKALAGSAKPSVSDKKKKSKKKKIEKGKKHKKKEKNTKVPKGKKSKNKKTKDKKGKKK